MKRMSLMLAALTLLVTGCVPGAPTLQGDWRLESLSSGPQSSTREIITYTFDGNVVTRILEQRIASFDGLLSASLVKVDRATFTVDESTSPTRIDLAGIAELAGPSTSAFASAAAIAGQTERGLTLAFLNRADATFINKGVLAFDNDRLQIKFGTTLDYPTDLIDALEALRTSKALGF